MRTWSPGLGCARATTNEPASAAPASPQGNMHLQTLLVECARSAVRHDGYLRSPCHRHVIKKRRLPQRHRQEQAIVVVAHVMIVIISLHDHREALP
jgi:hypothetical protein